MTVLGCRSSSKFLKETVDELDMNRSAGFFFRMEGFSTESALAPRMRVASAMGLSWLFPSLRGDPP